MIASTATILARIRPLLPSSPSASAFRRVSMPPLSMSCWRVFWSPVASSMHSAAWSWASRPAGSEEGCLSALIMARRGPGDCLSSCVPACRLTASSAEKPDRPFDIRHASSDWRNGSRILRPTAGRSTSSPFGRSVSASSVNAVAMRLCRGPVPVVPSAVSRHFSRAAVGRTALPSLPRRRRESSMVVRAVTPARDTVSASPSTKASAS
mmetsp:Transcript_115408/g.337474  ORF Transcript_115408/g.337474 Transcript_115408/m.337474 type:complete len:209 (-) Transcript_115408:897-1523(-)